MVKQGWAKHAACLTKYRDRLATANSIILRKTRHVSSSLIDSHILPVVTTCGMSSTNAESGRKPQPADRISNAAAGECPWPTHCVRPIVEDHAMDNVWNDNEARWN